MPGIIWAMKVMALKGFVVALMLLWGDAIEAVPASVISCNGRLVNVGDPVWQVARACPEPFWRDSYTEITSLDRFGQPLTWRQVEAWTIHFGANRFMRRLVFVDGYLRHIDTLGYGVRGEPGAQRCSWRQLETAGQTAAEVFARCGPPDFLIPLGPSDAFGGGPWTTQGQRQRWVYEFGPGPQARELEFMNGRLQFIRRVRP